MRWAVVLALGLLAPAPALADAELGRVLAWIVGARSIPTQEGELLVYYATVRGDDAVLDLSCAPAERLPRIELTIPSIRRDTDGLMTYRVDSKPPRQVRVLVDRDGKIVTTSGDAFAALLLAIGEARSLTVSVSGLTATFPVAGGIAAAGEVLHLCK